MILRLAELLAHMWGFITQQAEMQLKQQKEKKKADKVCFIFGVFARFLEAPTIHRFQFKVVYDSEERAFWRMRRPGHSNCLEQPVQKVCLYFYEDNG